MAIHLDAEAGDYAEVVLCPGDPQRATHIAEQFFDSGARCVSTVRGLLGYTGTYRGVPISVQSTGMGSASAGIICEELVMLGVRRLIRVGTCGALEPSMQLGELVIATAATADDPAAVRYAQVDGYAPVASFELIRRAADLAAEAGRRAHIGPIVTSAMFYDPDPTSFGRWMRAGHLAVEMEAAMVFAIAAVHHIEAMAMMTVSDLLGPEGHQERIDDDTLRQSVDTMLELACTLAISPTGG
jgi:DeoD family purine-nucleoside phosphorylase